MSRVHGPPLHMVLGVTPPTPPPHAQGGRDTYYIILHNVYICTYTIYVYTHVSIYIYIYIYVYIYIYDAALPGWGGGGGGRSSSSNSRSSSSSRHWYGYTGAISPPPPVGGWEGVVVAVSRSE